MGNKIKILHLENDVRDAELLEFTLNNANIDFEIERASNKSEFLFLIDENRFDVILSDCSFSDFDGIDALRLAKEISPETPFIFVTGLMIEELAASAIKFGASDYIFKGEIDKIPFAIEDAIKRCQEISNQKKEIEMLQISEAKYKNLFVSMSEGFVIGEIKRNNELDFVILEINKSFEDIFNVKKDFVAGKFITELNNLFDSQLIEKFCSIAANELCQQFEIYLPEIKKNLLIISYSPKKNQFAAIFIDSTKRFIIENEFKREKEFVEDLNKLKSFFLANISHELRTPLISILGFTEILKNELKDTDQIELTNHIIDGGNKLSEAINNILEISKVESLQSTLELKILHLSRFISNFIIPFVKQAELKKLYFNLEIIDNEVEISVDQEMFIKVLTNIFNNAIKFTKIGGITIRIRSEFVENKFYSAIDCIDSGIGISENQFEKIFEPFRQASEGYSKTFEGIGLGLTISQKLTNLMHGIISVKSKIGIGSTFTLKFPALIKESKTLSIKTKTSEIIPLAPKRKSEQKTILVVEDITSNMIVIERYLRDTYDVDLAKNANAAFNMAQEIQYDLILMDINLGEGENGIEIQKKIREIEGECYRNIPIIAVTAYVMAGDREKLLKAGFNDYLPKPFTKYILLTVVDSALSKNKI